MKKIISLVFIISFCSVFASDRVDPSEYMEPGDENSSYSLFPIVALAAVCYAIYRMFEFFKFAKGTINDFDKVIVFTCGICILLFAIGFFSVPYKYFIFLRYAISVGSIICLIYELQNKTEHHWKIYFLVILILHNPVYPIHLYYKPIWMIIDFLFGMIFYAKISTIVEKAEAS